MSPQMTRQNARNGDWEQFPVDLPNFLRLVLPGKIKLYCNKGKQPPLPQEAYYHDTLQNERPTLGHAGVFWV